MTFAINYMNEKYKMRKKYLNLLKLWSRGRLWRWRRNSKSKMLKTKEKKENNFSFKITITNQTISFSLAYLVIFWKYLRFILSFVDLGSCSGREFKMTSVWYTGILTDENPFCFLFNLFLSYFVHINSALWFLLVFSFIVDAWIKIELFLFYFKISSFVQKIHQIDRFIYKTEV